MKQRRNKIFIWIFGLLWLTALSSCSGVQRPAPVRNLSSDSTTRSVPVVSEEVKERERQRVLEQQRIVKQQEQLAAQRAAEERAQWLAKQKQLAKEEQLAKEMRLAKEKQLAEEKRLAKEKQEKATAAKRYRVKKSDSLYSIAFHFKMDFKTLARINKIRSPYVIHPGQYLSLKANSNNNNVAITERNTPKSTGPQTKPTANKNTRATKKSSAANIAKFDTRRKVKDWSWPVSSKSKKRYVKSQESEQGIDIIGRIGDPVVAAAAGVVVYSGTGLVGYDNLIIIKHSQSFLSAYANNTQRLVSENTVVRAGQKIATMGKNSTGKVQLHFEIRFEGKTVNPLKYIR